MAAILSVVANADDTLRLLRSDRRRSIYECDDGTFAIDYQGGVISRDPIDDLERSGAIVRRWPDQPTLNCWMLRGQ